jgi:5'(3')-deoxyribonucleotidase
MKKTIFIDIDGTVADSIPWWLSLYNVEHFETWQKSDVTEYGKIPSGLSQYYDDYRGVNSVDGANEAIERLSCYYRIVFVTVGQGEYWLKERYWDSEVIRIRDRSLLKGFAIIDDCDKNVESFDGLGFLVKQPWNPNGKTWKEITEELLSYANDDIADGVSVSPV